MKATKNGTGYIDIEGISAIATAKVAEYIADGYILNTGTMSGSQGDILKVDLVKGGKTVRIRMFDTYAGNRGNTVHVETSVYACGFEGGKAATLWNGDGDVIDTRSFYSITDYSPFGKLIYTEDEAEADRIEAIRNARRAAGYRKPRSRSRRVMTKIPSETVAEILKTRPGYKRIKSEDIGPVYRIDGHYYTELDRLPSKKAERVVKIA